MKLKSAQSLTAVALVLGAITLVSTTASFARGEGHQGRGGHGGMNMSFEELDVNGDGVLTEADTQARKAARFAETDTNNDGLLSVEEITAHAASKQNERMAERIAKMVDRHDADGDGMISVAELDSGGNGEKRGDRMLKRLDTDGNGEISKAEFEEMTAKMKKRHGGKKASE